MGCTPSNVTLMHVLTTELACPAHPVAALDARHCSPRATTLLFKKSSLSDGFQVRDITDRHALRFRTTTPSWLARRPSRHRHHRGHTHLVDASGSLVANFRPELDAPARASSSTLRQYIHTTTELRVEFVDTVSGQQCSAGMYGSWQNRSAIVWLQQGASGEPTPVAKLYSPMHCRSQRDEFCLSVSANVDTALLVLVCLALHEQQQEEGS